MWRFGDLDDSITDLELSTGRQVFRAEVHVQIELVTCEFAAIRIVSDKRYDPRIHDVELHLGIGSAIRHMTRAARQPVVTDQAFGHIKPRLLYHFKNRGYRGFCMNRPDKHFNKLSKTERELGGIPNSSEDVKQAHAAAIESYIEKHVGVLEDGEIGAMPFVRTLEDWARFDISNRTAFDATISSGLAVMANQKHLYLPEQKKSSISITLPRYNNRGYRSELNEGR